jgi:hypothetical protein
MHRTVDLNAAKIQKLTNVPLGIHLECVHFGVPPRAQTIAPLPFGFVRRKPRTYRILPLPRIRSGSRLDIG